MPVFGPNISGLFSQPTKSATKFFKPTNIISGFPLRIRVTGPSFGKNFVRLDFIPNDYVLYYDELTSHELLISSTESYLINYNNNTFLFSSSTLLIGNSLPSSLGNYNISPQHTIPTLQITASSPQSKVFDGSQASPIFSSSPTIVSSDFVFSPAAVNAGQYTLGFTSFAFSNKFVEAGPYPQISYEITKRPVQISLFDRVITFGGFFTWPAQAVIGAANTGLVSGDAQNNFPTLLLNVPQSGANAGVYNFSVNPNFSHPNYTISGYTNNKTTGTITIAKATPSITFNPQTSVAVGSNQTLVATTNPSNLTVTFSILSGSEFANITNGNVINFTGAGSISVRASIAESTNYLSTFVDRTFASFFPTAEGLPARVSTLSTPGGTFFGPIEINKSYTSWRSLTGSEVSFDGVWGWYNYVRSTTTINGGAYSAESFTSYLSKDVETYNGNRTIAYIILNPRHAVVHHYYGGFLLKSNTWVMAAIEVAYDPENGESYSASIVSTNPSSDALNLPLSGWSNNFKVYPQWARSIDVSVTRFFDFPDNQTQQNFPYTNYYQGTPVIRNLRKINVSPRLNTSAGYLASLITPYVRPNTNYLPSFYAKLHYQLNDLGENYGSVSILNFGFAFAPSGLNINNGFGDLPFGNPNFLWGITSELENKWVLTASNDWAHNDGSGYNNDAVTYYNNTGNNHKVLPPNFSSLSSPTWRIASTSSVGFLRPGFSSFSPIYSDTPVEDVIQGSGSMYSYLNTTWARLGVGETWGEDSGLFVFLKSGIGYFNAASGYLLCAPNSTIGINDRGTPNVYPHTVGFTAYTVPSNKWQILWLYYESDYGSFNINSTWEATGGQNQIPSSTFVFPGSPVAGTISFTPVSMY